MFKILHTSDWHLGKKLNGISRLEEQIQVLEEIDEICDEKDIEIVIIAGDIYDSFNPSIEAEKLFIKTIKKLSNSGQRLVIIIAGNHDSASRLNNLVPLANEYGILIYSEPDQIIEPKKYGNFEVINSNKGLIEVCLNGKKINILSLVYPTEMNLNLNMIDYDDEKYSSVISKKLYENMPKNTDIPLIIVSHLFVTGSSINSDEQLGGALSVELKGLPKANYIALGHIHKPQVFSKYNCAYSGSILEYRETEAKHKKAVLYVEIDEGTTIEKIPLKNQRPIKIVLFRDIELALKYTQENNKDDQWIYLQLVLEKPLTSFELKKLKENKSVIGIEIKTIAKGIDVQIESEKSIEVEFENNFLNVNGVKSTKRQTKLFHRYVKELNETN